MIDRILRKIFRKQFIENFNKYCTGPKAGHVLLYYKTDPLVFKSVAKDLSHTNHLEIIAMVKVFNKLGYWVDVIDRTIDIAKLRLEDKYRIFIGIGAGNSGKYYAQIASMVPSATRIFYALGPEPKLSNSLIERRYDYFLKRHPNAAVNMRRLVDNTDMKKIMDETDIIFAGGGIFSHDSYKIFNKEMMRFYCPIPTDIKINFSEFNQRSQKKFVYFGGNGNIVKGLDLVIEAFEGLPELELQICAPDWEEDFNEVYRDTLNQARNIHFNGFVKIGGEIFNKITSECGYVIFLSCSEGAANSALVCMRRGLVPVLTHESSVDKTEESGYLIKDLGIGALREQIKQISETSREEFIQKSYNAYSNSFEHTLPHFSENFEKMILKVLMKKSAK